MTRRQLRDPEAIRQALDGGRSLRLALRRVGPLSQEGDELIARLVARGVPVLEESDREMRRMAAAPGGAEILVLEGAEPPGDLAGLLAGGGLVLLLVGLRYPANAGFILRCAEVAGAAGVVLCSDWGAAQLAEAMRIAMRADRFLPVLRARPDEALSLARRAGRRIVAIETAGERTPWETSLEGSLLAVVGGEAEGIPADVLAQADEVLRIPVAGFIPSYNVQAAVGVFLGEWLRQGGDAGGR